MHPTPQGGLIGDTPIIILEDGKPRYVKICDWIDERMTAEVVNVRHFEERHMELLDLEPGRIYIPNTDNDGNVAWAEIHSVS